MLKLGSIPANTALGLGRSIGRMFGYELQVELSEHSIDISMVKPTTDEDLAWDDQLYRNGNVFVSGYSNPIKPRVDYYEDLENPNVVDVHEGNDGDEEELEEGDEHVQLISSPRYRDYMRQDLISQLLTPTEQWKLIAYGILVLGMMMAINWILVLYGTGQF